MIHISASAKSFFRKEKQIQQSSFQYDKRLCFFALPVFLISISCTSTGQQDNKSFLADLESKKSAPQEYVQSARFLPLEIKPGQKSHYLLRGPNDNTLSYEWSVQGSGDIPFSFWIEEVLVSENDRTEWRSLIVMDDARTAVSSTNADKFNPVITDYNRVSRVLTKRGNESTYTEQKLNDEAILPALGLKLSWFANAQWAKAAQTTVRAGQFKCFNAQLQLGTSPEPVSMNGCFDSSVPGNGLVKGKDSKGRSWELIQIN